MAGKVRIFELAKEVGLTSKELTALFNERLGGIFEAKNQLSVVPDQIADLVRSVLLKPKPQTAPPKASVPVASAAPAAPPKAAPEPAPPQEEPPAASPAPPVTRLRPVAPGTRTVARPPTVHAPSRPAAVTAVPPPVQQQPPPRVVPPRRPAEPIPQLRPVPAGQQSIVKRQILPTSATASASPGPQTGLPGRPGVAPRPGEVLPGQGGKGAAPPRGAATPRPIPPPRRPAGNGPFRAITPGTRPGVNRPGAAPTAESPRPRAVRVRAIVLEFTKTRRRQRKIERKSCCSKRIGSARRRESRPPARPRGRSKPSRSRTCSRSRSWRPR